MPNASPTPGPSTNPSQAPSSSTNPSVTPTHSPNPTLTSETSQFSTQTVVKAAAAIAALIAVFALAFKKGFITIEVADEQEDKGQEGNQDYVI